MLPVDAVDVLSVNPDYEPAKEGIAAAMKALHSNNANDVDDHEHPQVVNMSVTGW